MYTAGELSPPLWNWILMLRPIDAEGTCRYSTGRPGRENAPAVAEPPVTSTTPTRPDSRAAPTAPITSRRGLPVTAPRNLSTSFILSFLIPLLLGASINVGRIPNQAKLHARGAAVPV